jgi:hypothetical protein
VSDGLYGDIELLGAVGLFENLHCQVAGSEQGIQHVVSKCGAIFSVEQVHVLGGRSRLVGVFEHPDLIIGEDQLAGMRFFVKRRIVFRGALDCLFSAGCLERSSLWVVGFQLVGCFLTQGRIVQGRRLGRRFFASIDVLVLADLYEHIPAGPSPSFTFYKSGGDELTQSAVDRCARFSESGFY